MSSGDELITSKFSSSLSNGVDSFAMKVFIHSVTGHTWEESITPLETIRTLKDRIWQRTGLVPYHQSLIFGEVALADFNEITFLRDIGIRDKSTLRLAIITRSGPISITTIQSNDLIEEYPLAQPATTEVIDSNTNNEKECADNLNTFDEEKLDENRRMMFRMCELRRRMKQNNSTKAASSSTENDAKHAFSAPEDTSAKESSECDEDKSGSGVGGIVLENKKLLLGSLPIPKITGKFNRQTVGRDEVSNVNVISGGTQSGARDRLLTIVQPRVVSPSTDLNTHSEDGSEFSSGMIVCDLSNEFRRDLGRFHRLRVRRKHHGVSGGSTAFQRARARSKPRQPLAAVAHQHRGSDVTSSDDDRPLRRVTDTTGIAGGSGLRRTSMMARAQQRMVGCQSQQRCCACAVKLNFSTAFQCRCGKTLCSRHRPTDMHTCGRPRRMQDVSD